MLEYLDEGESITIEQYTYNNQILEEDIELAEEIIVKLQEYQDQGYDVTASIDFADDVYYIIDSQGNVLFTSDSDVSAEEAAVEVELTEENEEELASLDSTNEETSDNAASTTDEPIVEDLE